MTAMGLFALPPFLAVWLILTLVGVLAVTILALNLVGRLQQTGLLTRMGIEIGNQGNLACAFEVRAESSHDDVTMRFNAGSIPMTEVTYNEAAPPAPASAAGQTTPRVLPSGAGTPDGRLAVATTAQRGLATAGALATLLNTFSMLLPSSLRSAAWSGSSQLRQAEWMGSRVMQVPRDLSQVRETAGSANAESTRGQAQVGGAQESQPGLGTVTVRRAWAQTPVVSPGETLTLEMVVTPRRRLWNAPRAFTVFLRPAGIAQATSVAEQGSLIIGQASALRRYGPRLAVLLCGVLLLVLAYWAIITSASVL